MRRLFLVGLSCVALACGDVESDSASSGGSGTGGSTSTGDSTGTPPLPTPGATGSTSGLDSGSSSEATSGATSPGTSSGESGQTQGSETGASEAESGGETGPALPRGQWAITEITYSGGGNSETLSMQDRAFCDATLSADSLQLRYQQADGYTVWTVTIPTSATVGSLPLTQDFSGVFMNINEVGDAWQTYFDPSMAFGSLELTEASLQSSGVVAGVLTATLTSGNGTTADFSSTFYAEIP